jgi:two-component system NarL family response regulator
MIRVCIVDDHPLMRRGIREMLEDQADIEVVGEGQDGEEAIALAQEKSPDVMLKDVEMPKLDGVEATRRILADNPEIKVLVLTIHDEEEYLGALIHAGASGYALKSTGCEDLTEAVRLVGHGDIVLDSKAGMIVRSAMARSHKRAEEEKDLTDRQMQVLRWMAQGLSNKEMARRLGLSLRTMKGDVTKVLTQLKVKTRSAAVAAAIRDGVLKAEDL